MSLLPGTHHYGNLAYAKSRAAKDSYTDLVPSGIEEITKKVPELHCYLELGDCVIFHKDTIHKSNYNGSTLCRPVGVSSLTQGQTGVWGNQNPDDL